MVVIDDPVDQTSAGRLDYMTIKVLIKDFKTLNDSVKAIANRCHSSLFLDGTTVIVIIIITTIIITNV